MKVFLLGLASGGLSGGLTYHETGDPQIAIVLGILAAILAWVIGGIVVAVAGTSTSTNFDLWP